MLPQNPEMPADLYTSCLTTTVKTALHYWFHQQKITNINIIDCIEYLDNIPGKYSARSTMAGTVLLFRFFRVSLSTTVNHCELLVPEYLALLLFDPIWPGSPMIRNGKKRVVGLGRPSRCKSPIFFQYQN